MALDEAFRKCASQLCEDIDTPRSLSIYLMLKYGELLQLTSVTVQPTHYLTSEEYFKDAVVTNLLRKCDIPGVRPPDQLKTECWERLLSTERLCAKTNVRLAPYISEQGPFLDPRDLRLLPYIHRIRKRIARVLGQLTDSVFDECRFGPGATTTNPGKLSTIPDKLDSLQTGTRSALFLFRTFFRGCGWDRAAGSGGRQETVVGASRFFTVPKDATKLRGACLSPNINGFLQLGVGSYIRKKLRRVGIRIKGDGVLTPDLHRALAAHGSTEETWATIDLSDASNTIAYNLIKLLWPSDWFDLLDMLREPRVIGPSGTSLHLEMFSAMGNGFTFEMETLTFWAIASECCDSSLVSVFGDDIIVPQHAASDVMSLLRFFGFIPNPRKTFISGPFRESCGGDFFNGVPVKAHHVKTLPSQPADWISLANAIRSMAFGSPVTEHRWSYLRRAWLCCLSALPVQYRALKGPADLGDAVLHDYPEQWTIRVKNSIRYVRGLVARSEPLSWHHWKPAVVLASALYGCGTDGPIPRNGPISHRIVWLAYS